MGRRSKRKNKRNGKSKKQPEVGRMMFKEHINKYRADRDMNKILGIKKRYY